jgi:hypothetical protein
MLPVQTWHEREQEAEAIEFGDQARVDGIGRGEIHDGFGDSVTSIPVLIYRLHARSRSLSENVRSSCDYRRKK